MIIPNFNFDIVYKLLDFCFAPTFGRFSWRANVDIENQFLVILKLCQSFGTNEGILTILCFYQFLGFVCM